jgi:hypothetical protein
LDDRLTLSARLGEEFTTHLDTNTREVGNFGAEPPIRCLSDAARRFFDLCGGALLQVPL